MKIRFKGPVEVEFEFDDKKLDALIEKFVSCIKRCDMGYVPEQPHTDATPDEDYSDEDPDVDLFAPLDDDCVDLEPDATEDVDMDAKLAENHEDVEPATAQEGEQGQTGAKKRSVKKQVNGPKPGRTDQEVEDFKNMLEEIAKNAENFEQFVENVAQKLELGKQEEFFKQLVMVATEVEELTWSAIEKKMGNTSSKQAMLSPKLKKKNAPNALYLLMMILQYQEYPFRNKQPEACAPTALAEETAAEATLPEKKETTRKTVIMKCMGGVELGEIDTTWTLKQKVEKVLGNMKMEGKSLQNHQQILDIAIAAVNSELQNDVDLANAIRKAIPGIEDIKVPVMRMHFYDLIKSYTKKTVNVLTFLQELKRVLTM